MGGRQFFHVSTAALRPGETLDHLRLEPRHDLDEEVAALFFSRGVGAWGETILTRTYRDIRRLKAIRAGFGGVSDMGRLSQDELERVLAEAVFESVRDRDFPHLPSRLAGLHGVADARVARMLLEHKRPQSAHAAVWVVEATDWHAGDYRLLTTHRGEYLLETYGAALRYWRGDFLGGAELHVEHVLRLPVTILRRATEVEALAVEDVKREMARELSSWSWRASNVSRVDAPGAG